jgi:adenylylsulfate kinase
MCILVMKTSQLTEHQYKITPVDRETNNGHKAICLWFTGLSCSGKSTLANFIEQELFGRGIKTFVLDGDNIRQGLNKGLAFTEADRVENLRRIGEVSKLMCDAGLVVLAAFISPFEASRKSMRAVLGDRYIEIFVDAPLEVCEQRDIKGLYKKARNGEISNFTGVSAPFERPAAPDIHIETSKYSIEQSVALIMDHIVPKIRLEGN